MLEYLFVTFIVTVCIQSIFYLFIFGNFSFSKKKAINIDNTKSVSILICCKNESENIEKNLSFFINQDYPNFELVLINDGSTDNTLDIFEKFEKNSSIPIKIVDVKPNEQFWGSKKYALTLGIKAASHEYLLFSDADCKPISTNWVKEIMSSFTPSKQIVLGYGAYSKVKGSIVNKLIRFETLLTAVQYFSFAKLGAPYMGVGRNLAYTKSVFFKNKGFVNHMQIKSGDDDLFINEVANSKNTAICIVNDSFTLSNPKTSLKYWIQQKKNHILTSYQYKFSHKVSLALFYFSQIMFWVTGTVLLIFTFNWKLVLALIFTRFLIVYLSLGFSAKKLNEQDLILFLPFFEIFLIFTQLFIFIKNLISKP
ncbi:glycosyltransferase [Lutibacter citreus]|uniref:glycosyltransferase n=1 Tax=Lutibacter citreus TaxID=2138210 RepID=UPI000DBE1E31|nr:glycosyltransferase [Lutibacter citreus]